MQTIERELVAGTRWSRRRVSPGFLYVLPSLLFVVVFFLIPLAMVIWMSLHDWQILSKVVYRGRGASLLK